MGKKPNSEGGAPRSPVVTRRAAHGITNSEGGASAAQPVPQPAGSSAAEPAPPQSLRELNKRSAQFGSWDVVIQQCLVDSYKYTYDGKERSGKNFSCTLVSPHDPSDYCEGHMRFNKKDEKKFSELLAKLTNGLAFTMSNISINTEAKKKYIHSPIQTVVNVLETNFSPLLHSKDTNDCYPEPPASIADCANLTSEQFFDVIALVRSVTTCRNVADNRVVFDAEIIDGSTSNDRVRTMQLTVFTERGGGASHGEPPLWAFLKKAAGHGSAVQPVSFFRIKGVQHNDKNFSFTTTKNSLIVGGATTRKGRRLAAEATTLLGLTDTDGLAVKKFEEWVPRDFSIESARETMCALFKTIANVVHTGVEALDNPDETFWQINWVRIEEPPAGSNIRTNDGKRLWFPVTVRDCTGTLTLFITETAALKLSGIEDADQFESAFVDGKMWFPQMASVKIIRQRKSASSGIVDGQPPVQVDIRIVDAASQELVNAPTQETVRLLSLLNNENTTADVVIPAALHMLRKSPLYTLAVETNLPDIPDSMRDSFVNVPTAKTVFRPCTQVLCLVESSKPCSLQETGAGGLKLITKNVKDLLNDAEDAKCVQLTSFCTKENLQDFKMDPPRTHTIKKQAAIVVISSILAEASAEQPASFMVDSVQLLQPTEVNEVKICLKRMLFLTTFAGHMSSRKREAVGPPTQEESPTKAGRCRALGRHPSAPPLPEFD